MRRLLVATTNAGKLREIRTLLGGTAVDLLCLADLPALAAPDETGTTFAENARLKATYYAAHTGELTVAEDSGLSIEGLAGEPGVHSARFLRPDAPYPERFADIYRRLALVPDAPRSARFVCALVAMRGPEVAFETVGTVEGVIAPFPSGAGGFGYDPIFLFPPFGKTLADMGEDSKLQVAHRGHAFRALAEWLRRT